MVSSPALQLSGFSLSFGRGAVLNRLDLSVPDRGCTVLLGPSGTGKSSLLYWLGGRLDGHPHARIEGDARYFGGALAGDHRPALVEQKPHLLVQSVRESLVSLWPRRGTLDLAQQTEQLVLALQSWHLASLAGKLDTCVVHLALHERRMVAILRQWLAGPSLLMIDEPTAELPDSAAAEVLALLGRLKQERPLLVVSHHLQQTRVLADHVLLLASGQLQEFNTCNDFFERPRSAAARQFLRTGSCPEQAREMHGAAEGAVASPPEPPQPQLGTALPAPSVQAGCGPDGFVWLLPGQLAGTPWPGVFYPQAHDLASLRGAGVTRLLSLTETPFDPSVAAAHGLETAAEPIVDGDAPTWAQAERLCRQIDAWLLAREAVAAHCHAGLGRTGTILAAYLLWCARKPPHVPDAASALERVRRLRPGMVQTRAQEHFLYEFAQQLAASLVD